MIWDDWLLGLAQYASTKSKDPSTKVGAVISRPDNTIASVGYNGFPRGIKDDVTLLSNRDEKYKRMVHAEMNAILACKDQSLEGYTLYTWPFMPCERCAVHIIQAGIKRVVAPRTPNGAYDRWADNFRTSIRLFQEGGVQLTWR